MEKNLISSDEVNALLAKVKAEMNSVTLPSDVIEGTRIVVIHPEYWEISLLVPYMSRFGLVRATVWRKHIEDILFTKCGVNPDWCDYFGKQTPKKAYEWYFRHPNIPQKINDLIEAEIEAKLGNEVGLGLPSPNKSKSKSDIAFMTIKDEFFREIECGRKTTEYRNINQYYCDKLFPNGKQKKFVKFNRGYLSGAGNQITFEIASIVIVSERGEEIPALDERGRVIDTYSQLPKNFAPSAYGIKLGRRIA